MRLLFGDCVLDLERRQLFRGGEEMHLSPKAFEVMKVLVEKRPGAVSKRELYERVWPGTFVSDDSLARAITEIRGAIGDDARKPRFVRTLYGFGYALADDFVKLVDPDPVPAVAQQLEALPETASTAASSATAALGISQPGPGAAAQPKSRSWAGLLATAAIMLIGGLALLVLISRTTPRAPLESGGVSFVVLPPEGTTLSPSASLLSLSPDGRQVTFLASSADGTRRLWIRSLSSVSARELPETDDALGPFWSPDSRNLGFFAAGKLKKIDIFGGKPQVLCEYRAVTPGGTWNGEDLILFGGEGGGLSLVPARGGTPSPVTSLDASKTEISHVLPYFLPDGRHFTYVIRTAQKGQGEAYGEVYLGSLDSRERTRLVDADSQALFALPDYLLFMREGVLYAQLFDAARRRLVGEPTQLAERVGFNPAGPRGMFSASQNGVLAYRAQPQRELVWFDRAGRHIGTLGTLGYRDPALSPDSRHLAVDRFDPATRTRSIWIVDLERGVASRLTSGQWDMTPVWSPDGSRVAFASYRKAGIAILEKPASGGGKDNILLEPPSGYVEDWSRDGRFIVYTQPDSAQNTDDLWQLSLLGERKHAPLLKTPFRERGPRLSPNGRWLAYASDETGRSEIYVRSFPGDQDRWRISTSGGVEPKWRSDGKELYYIAADQKLMAVPVRADGAFQIDGAPVPLFQTRADGSGRLGIVGHSQYVVSPDGQRFLVNQVPPDAPPPPITVVMNWEALLR